MTLSYHFIPVSYIFVTLEKKQKKRLRKETSFGFVDY